jgi:hypothetical protein
MATKQLAESSMTMINDPIKYRFIHFVPIFYGFLFVCHDQTNFLMSSNQLNHQSKKTKSKVTKRASITNNPHTFLLANHNNNGCLFNIKHPTIKHLDVHSILQYIT